MTWKGRKDNVGIQEGVQSGFRVGGAQEAADGLAVGDAARPVRVRHPRQARRKARVQGPEVEDGLAGC